MHFGESEAEVLVAVDWVWELRFDRFGPEVAEGGVGGGVEGFEGEPAAVALGGEGWGGEGEGEDQGGCCEGFHGCGDWLGMEDLWCLGMIEG